MESVTPKSSPASPPIVIAGVTKIVSIACLAIYVPTYILAKSSPMFRSIVHFESWKAFLSFGKVTFSLGALFLLSHLATKLIKSSEEPCNQNTNTNKSKDEPESNETDQTPPSKVGADSKSEGEVEDAGVSGDSPPSESESESKGSEEMTETGPDSTPPRKLDADSRSDSDEDGTGVGLDLISEIGESSEPGTLKIEDLRNNPKSITEEHFSNSKCYTEEEKIELKGLFLKELHKGIKDDILPKEADEDFKKEGFDCFMEGCHEKRPNMAYYSEMLLKHEMIPLLQAWYVEDSSSSENSRSEEVTRSVLLFTAYLMAYLPFDKIRELLHEYDILEPEPMIYGRSRRKNETYNVGPTTGLKRQIFYFFLWYLQHRYYLNGFNDNDLYFSFCIWSCAATNCLDFGAKNMQNFVQEELGTLKINDSQSIEFASLSVLFSEMKECINQIKPSDLEKLKGDWIAKNRHLTSQWQWMNGEGEPEQVRARWESLKPKGSDTE